jgi:hypothetical protein
MPSNHSCFVWFVATFVYLLHATMGGHRGRQGHCHCARRTRWCAIRPLLCRRRSTLRRRRRRLPPVYRHLHSTVAVASSLAVATGCAYSRVCLGYHMIPQVVIRLALGSSLGAVWYALFDTAVVRLSLVRWDGMRVPPAERIPVVRR